MKLDKAKKRDKRKIKRDKMIITNRSIFIIQDALIKRGGKAKDKQDNKKA